MFSLTLRVTAIMVGALLTVVVATLTAFYLQNRNGIGGPRFPLPDRVAAIVELLEHVPAEERERVLTAVNTPEIRVALRPGPIIDADQPQVSLPWLAWITQRYLAALGDRHIVAGIDDQLLPRHRLAALFMDDEDQRRMEPLRMLVELSDGQVLLVESRDQQISELLTRPFALAVLFTLLLIALVGAWVLKRQIRPLEALAREAESVGTTLEGARVRVEGAPEVRRLVLAFERMRERLRLLLESRTRMLGAISHDLGTYMTRLRLRVDYIDDPGQRERAERDLIDMQQLLSDALMLARLDHDVTISETVDLRELVESHLRAWAEAGNEVGLSVSGVVNVKGRRAPLARVLSNLVGNAIKYGQIAELSLERLADARGSWVELRVDDRGPGIPVDERERVLEPFYRADASRNLDQPGSGLGLSIVADVVRRHGGSLHLEDRPGGGLRVRVRLPAA